MNYYGLFTTLVSKKTSFELCDSSDSLYIAGQRDKPYIEPEFEKIVYNEEKPRVILVSAVGATGKTALAQVLSSQTRLPILDLSKHKPVGDNTLTGIITNSYRIEDLSNIHLGIANGTYGMIIDGIDEGRAKTSEKAFEAFLDDICRLCGNSTTGTSFILLGRTQVLEDCWLYLTDKGIISGLISILPFDQLSAERYIDKYVADDVNKSQKNYLEVRNYILQMLGHAFVGKSEKDFISFIGYPPVLDAIVTLLSTEKNYFKLHNQIVGTLGQEVEIELLIRIADVILSREKEEKIVPNILNDLVSELPEDLQNQVISESYTAEEQCLRLIAFLLKKELNLRVIDIPQINESYEKALRTFLLEHPFIIGNEFRNVVFEGFALAKLMTSSRPECKNLVLEYLLTRKNSYHIINFLSVFSKSLDLPSDFIYVLLGSANEFISPTSSIEINIDESENDSQAQSKISIEIEIILGGDRTSAKTFSFSTNIEEGTSVYLGSRLSNSYISLPCNVILSSAQEIELTGPIEISAKCFIFSANSLILRNPQGKGGKDDDNTYVLLQADKYESQLTTITRNEIDFRVVTNNEFHLTYPLIYFEVKQDRLPTDPNIREKYFRLRGIIMLFRSHSKGALARLKYKIEHARVIKNEIGQTVLDRLIKDDIITLIGKWYFLDMEKINQFLGVSYIDLRTGKQSEKLIKYLKELQIISRSAPAPSRAD